MNSVNDMNLASSELNVDTHLPQNTSISDIIETPMISPLFPEPFVMTKIKKEFNSKELEFIKSQRGKYNDAILKEKEMHLISESIQELLDWYVDAILVPSKPLEIYITKSWLTFMDKEQSMPPHRHDNSFMSGVLYIDVDEKTDHINFVSFDRNFLSFGTKETNPFNTKQTGVSVKNGSLVLFPSHIHHFVTPVKNENTRISLSFNTFVKGDFL